MSSSPEIPIVQASDQREWRQWLQQNHDSVAAVWLKLAKKGSPTATVSYGDAVEEALCYGWIDGQVRAHDDHFYLQRFTPRRPRSRWSPGNREKATRLIAEGRMRPAGLAEVEAARADGRWDAVDPPGRARAQQGPAARAAQSSRRIDLTRDSPPRLAADVG